MEKFRKTNKNAKKNIFYIYSPKTKNKIKKLSAQSRNLDGFNIEYLINNVYLCGIIRQK